jgi:iron complex transport system substrate-binding protein
MSPVPQRLVSLIASSTEIVCALGLGERLVGRSHECDYPEWVKRLPVVTSPKFQPDGTSYEIDQRVKAIVQEGLSVYRVDGERLRELRPDLILTQSHCEVCAVSQKDVEQAVHDWLDGRPQVVSLSPSNLADVWTSIRLVAGSAGVPSAGEELIERLSRRIDAIEARSASLQHRPTVACIEWIEPLMAAGNWMPELVERAGGINLFGEAGKHSPWMIPEQLVQRDADVIFVSPCGFNIERTRQEMPRLAREPWWQNLKAVRNEQVYLGDGNEFFKRPGPRLVESLEILAEILHPELFAFGHEGTGWVRCC